VSSKCVFEFVAHLCTSMDLLQEPFFFGNKMLSLEQYKVHIANIARM
jgi:hypothetical protein